MLKVGDKVLCKKNLYTFVINFKEGEYYNVCLIIGDNCEVYEAYISDITVEESKDKDMYGSWFSLEENKKINWFDKIYEEHFYTDKELRKLKLEKIKNES